MSNDTEMAFYTYVVKRNELNAAVTNASPQEVDEARAALLDLKRKHAAFEKRHMEEETKKWLEAMQQAQ